MDNQAPSAPGAGPPLHKIVHSDSIETTLTRLTSSFLNLFEMRLIRRCHVMNIVRIGRNMDNQAPSAPGAGPPLDKIVHSDKVGSTLTRLTSSFLNLFEMRLIRRCHVMNIVRIGRNMDNQAPSAPGAGPPLDKIVHYLIVDTTLTRLTSSFLNLFEMRLIRRCHVMNIVRIGRNMDNQAPSAPGAGPPLDKIVHYLIVDTTLTRLTSSFLNLFEMRLIRRCHVMNIVRIGRNMDNQAPSAPGAGPPLDKIVHYLIVDTTLTRLTSSFLNLFEMRLIRRCHVMNIVRIGRNMDNQAPSAPGAGPPLDKIVHYLIVDTTLTRLTSSFLNLFEMRLIRRCHVMNIVRIGRNMDNQAPSAPGAGPPLDKIVHYLIIETTLTRLTSSFLNLFEMRLIRRCHVMNIVRIGRNMDNQAPSAPGAGPPLDKIVHSDKVGSTLTRLTSSFLNLFEMRLIRRCHVMNIVRIGRNM